MILHQLANFNVADYVIVGIILASTLISLSRGFIKESLSLIIWIVDFWVAISYYEQFSKVFDPYINSKPTKLIISFLFIFIVVLIVGAVFNFLFAQLIAKTGLTAIDRMFGMVFGFARGLAVISIVLLMISETGMAKDLWWKHSVLIPHFDWLIDWFRTLLPKKIIDTSVGSVIPSVPDMN